MTGRTPPAVFNSSTAPIDQDWVDAELIPFLQRVYPEERKTTMEWNRQVVLGRAHLDWLVSNPNANLLPISRSKSTHCIYTKPHNGGKIREVHLGHTTATPPLPYRKY